MDFLNGKISSIYFKYLSAAFGSAMVTSIYSIVDTVQFTAFSGRHSVLERPFSEANGRPFFS